MLVELNGEKRGWGQGNRWQIIASHHGLVLAMCRKGMHRLVVERAGLAGQNEAASYKTEKANFLLQAQNKLKASASHTAWLPSLAATTSKRAHSSKVSGQRAKTKAPFSRF